MSKSAASSGPDPKSMIPKIIHYVWVGGKPFPPEAAACLASWQKQLPDYEFKLWNEANSPMHHHYVQAMSAQKKWAFVSDYIRFWALAREGGIYLDTDMEVFKSLDQFLYAAPGFLGQSKRGDIESSIIGAVPGAPFVLAALQFYDMDRSYTIKNSSPLVVKQAIETAGVPRPHIYEYTYFHPTDEGEVPDQKLLDQAYARHHWAESWVPFASLRKLARRLRVMPLLRKIRHDAFS